MGLGRALAVSLTQSQRDAIDDTLTSIRETRDRLKTAERAMQCVLDDDEAEGLPVALVLFREALAELLRAHRNIEETDGSDSG